MQSNKLYDPIVMQALISKGEELTLHNYIKQKRKSMFIVQTKEGWTIRNPNGEIHMRVYSTARKANEVLEKMVSGLVRFEPHVFREYHWND